MPKIEVTPEFIDTLRDAADEIASLSGPDNDVCLRLRTLLRQVTPQSVTVGQLAKQVDIAPHDVLDAAIAVGVKPFWHDGQPFREASYLRTYLRLEYPYDPAPEIEFELMPETARQLAEKLGVDPEELWSDFTATATVSQSPPRRFVASETNWPVPVDVSHRGQTG